MPSCEFPASRMTASLIFCGRRSALPATGAGAEAKSGKAEGVLTTKRLMEVSGWHGVCQWRLTFGVSAGERLLVRSEWPTAMARLKRQIENENDDDWEE